MCSRRGCSLYCTTRKGSHVLTLLIGSKKGETRLKRKGGKSFRQLVKGRKGRKLPEKRVGEKEREKKKEEISFLSTGTTTIVGRKEIYDVHRKQGVGGWSKKGVNFLIVPAVL